MFQKVILHDERQVPGIRMSLILVFALRFLVKHIETIKNTIYTFKQICSFFSDIQICTFNLSIL